MVCFFFIYIFENIIYIFVLFFRIEMYCRELIERFEDVWIVFGLLILFYIVSDGKKIVSY